MSFQQGLSGLSATSKSLEIIGNNIANAGTYGAKMARAEFADVYAAAVSGTGQNPTSSGNSQIGIGTTLATVAQQFNQGNITTTDNPMDLAINGSGFFQLMDSRGTHTYSRNGQFKIDREGFVVTNSGSKLLGYTADSNGVVQTGTAAPIQLPTAGIAPKPTTSVKVELNLDASQKITAKAANITPAIDFKDPSTFNNATSVTVYDAKGQTVALTYYFQKAAADTWNVYATANGVPVNGTADAPLKVDTITYEADGSAPKTPAGGVLSIDVPPTNAGNGITTTGITGLKFDISKSTQFGAGFGVTNISQDGSSPGTLSKVTVEADGVITARYSNGLTKAAGQIEMANFRNPQGLAPGGDNGWIATIAAGEPVLGTAGQGNMGLLQSGALEESNIDLTAELVNMITTQRSYQANAQTIKTMDQALQTLVNLR